MQGGATAVIAGATKSLEINCRLVNGAYDLTGELYNGRVLFRKRGDDSLCLRFTKSGHWMVSPVANKDANDDLGYAYCSDQDQHLPPPSEWGVSDGKTIVADEGITVTLSDALKSMVRCYVLPSFFVSFPAHAGVCTYSIFAEWQVCQDHEKSLRVRNSSLVVVVQRCDGKIV
jgi:hypothetical protein